MLVENGISLYLICILFLDAVISYLNLEVMEASFALISYTLHCLRSASVYSVVFLILSFGKDFYKMCTSLFCCVLAQVSKNKPNKHSCLTRSLVSLQVVNSKQNTEISVHENEQQI